MSDVVAAPITAAVHLLAAHADRALTGDVDDPAVLAAVVGVERIAMQLGTADATVIGRAIEVWAAQPSEDDLIGSLVDRVVDAAERSALGWGRDASALNADAGAYPVAYDATLLRAGARAAHRSFARVPYYEARYGMRGSNFAASDSAWLVQLVEQPHDEARDQVLWLSRLLANRGMPSWLMELHLAELGAQVRGEGFDASSIEAAAAHLEHTRQEVVADDVMVQAEDWATSRLETQPVEGAALLVTAAVADTARGYAKDESKVLDWLTDPSRCTARDAAALVAIRDEVASAGGE